MDYSVAPAARKSAIAALLRNDFLASSSAVAPHLFLLSQGADFTPRNKWGATALDEAKKSFRSIAAMALLRAAGATE